MNYEEDGRLPAGTPSQVPEWTRERLKKAMTDVDGAIINLYKTMVRTPFKEPIRNLQNDILRLDGVVDDDRFLRTCLTTPYLDTDQYLEEVARRFDFSITGEFRVKFKQLVEREKFGIYAATDVQHNLERLSKQLVLALGTNSWPFPVTKFLDESKLRTLFAHLVISSEIGIAKQDGPEFFRVASLMMNLPPERVVTVDDNPVLALLPAAKAGNKVILCDRYFEYVNEEGKWIDALLVARHPELLTLELAVIRDFNQIPDPIRS